MFWDPTFRPRLRPVEAFPVPEGDGVTIALRDRSGLSETMLGVSMPVLSLLAMMDGNHTCDDIRGRFQASFGRALSAGTLHAMVTQLENAHLLEGPGFESFYEVLLEEYRKRGTREIPQASGLGIVDHCGAIFDELLTGANGHPLAGTVAGLIAPHLDYPRGRPCYAAAYATLRNRPPPRRVVILGTNHFGRSTSVVATANDFRTPLGVSRVDRAFVEELEKHCGDLRTFELDHAKEHSVELQVAWLQYLFGAETFSIVPVLCPDPCGPTGIVPADGRGLDLRQFAMALSGLLKDDEMDFLIVAGADLSHVGPRFGDERPLDDAFLDEVRDKDRQALDRLAARQPEAFRQCVAEEDNPTRICSAGCIFVLATALSDASVSVLGYHQAVDVPSQTCVTCAAVAFT